MISDYVYRPPAIDPEANHSIFAPDEWRYMKKVFAAWIVGGSLFMALYGTWLFGWSLSQFGAQEYTALVVQQLLLWMPGVLGLTTPIAIALIFGSSLALTTYGVEVPWADSWKGMQRGTRWTDFAISIFTVVVITALIMALVPQVMRLLFRFRGWLILKFIVIAFAIAPILSVVRVLCNVIVGR